MTPTDLIVQWAEGQGFGVRPMGPSYIAEPGDWVEIWEMSYEGLFGKKQVRLVVWTRRHVEFVESLLGSWVMKPLDVLVRTKIPVTWNLADPHFFDKLGERIRYEWDVVLK